MADLDLDLEVVRSNQYHVAYDVISRLLGALLHSCFTVSPQIVDKHNIRT